MSASAFYSLQGPLDTIPSERQMRTANFGGFAGLVRTMGGDPRRILEHHGMDPQSIRDPDSFVDCQSLVDVLEYSSTLFNDSLLGLKLARLQEPEVFGCVTTLCRAAPNFRTALESFIEYIPVVHSPVAKMELVVGAQTAELRWGVSTDLGFNIQANYQAALLDLNFLRTLGARGFRASYVTLAVDSRAKDISEIENTLGCRFHDRAPSSAIAFPVELLDQPLAGSNKLLFKLLGGYLDCVKAASRTTIVQRVEDYIRGSLSSGSCSIERCARRLGTSVRTLQSHLSEHQLKFSDILERQRQQLANGYLEQQQLSLDEVAALLGYSEQSSFGRAFKRWTGSTPQRFREELGSVNSERAGK